MPNKKISASALLKYWRCPEYYRKIYVGRELKKEPPSPEMCVGIAVHAAIDFAMKKKIENVSVDIPEMMVMAENALRKELMAALEASTDPADIINPQGAMQTKYAEVQRAVMTVHKKLLPVINPIASEYHFFTEWRPGWDIEGYIDLLALEKDSSISVIDWKIGTSSRTPDQNTAEVSVQLPLYAIMARRTLSYIPKKGILYHYVPSKMPHFLAREVEFTDRYLDAITLRVNRTLDAIEAGQYPAGDPFWSCNAKRCPVFSGCEMGAGK